LTKESKTTTTIAVLLSIVVLLVSPAMAAHFTVVPGVNNPTQTVLNPATNKLYVFGDQGVAVIDALTGKTITYFIPPSEMAVGWFNLVALNQARNKIYVAAGQTLYVIDGATDAVTQTAVFPTNINRMVFNPASNKLYISQTFTAVVTSPNFSGTVPEVGQVLSLNGDSLATLATIQATSMTNIGVPPSSPDSLLVNPATNKLYILFSRGITDLLQIVDGNTDTIVKQPTCDATGCHNVISAGIGAMGINPRDNSIWLSADTTPGGAVPCNPAGTDPSLRPVLCPFPPQSVLFRIDGLTNNYVNQGTFFGTVSSITAIDPLTGFIYGTATNLPRTANPQPGTLHTIDFKTAFLDPVNHVVNLISIDGSNLTTPAGSILSCGTVQAGVLQNLGMDLQARKFYFGCDGTLSTKSSVIVATMDLTPLAGSLPPEFRATFVSQIPTGAQTTLLTNQGEVLPRLDSTHKLAFADTPENLVVVFDPASSTSVSVPLIKPVVVPDFILNVKIADTHGAPVAGVPVGVAGGTVKASGLTDATGTFSFPGLLTGAYTVSFVPTGLIPLGATSQLVGVSADSTTTFTVLTAPVQIAATVIKIAQTPAASLVPAFVQINQPAPAGGVVIALSASNLKIAKVPATVTIPAGQIVVGFNVQVLGTGAAATITVLGTYTGPLAPFGTAASSAPLAVFPVDTLHVTKATWSRSTGQMVITATSTNPVSTVSVILSNNSAQLGTMVGLGNGNFSFQTTYTSTVPSAVNLKSIFGGSTGQGLTIIP